MSLKSLAVSLLLSLGLFAVSSCGSGRLSSSNPPPGPPGAVTLQQVATGLASPLDLETPPDNSGRLFVVEQGGTIHIIQNGTLMPAPYLDISGKVFNSGESGLLGLTFHPFWERSCVLT